MPAAALQITGRVQGVGFRAWFAREAARHGLCGWVRNEVDGSVGALVKGSQASIDAMVEACRDGPPAAHVTHVEVTPATLQGLRGFQIAC